MRSRGAAGARRASVVLRPRPVDGRGVWPSESLILVPPPWLSSSVSLPDAADDAELDPVLPARHGDAVVAAQGVEPYLLRLVLVEDPSVVDLARLAVGRERTNAHLDVTVGLPLGFHELRAGPVRYDVGVLSQVLVEPVRDLRERVAPRLQIPGQASAVDRLATPPAFAPPPGRSRRR